MKISRYPRLGQRIAPATLAPELRVEVAVTLPAGSALVSLDTLDKTAWERFGEGPCRELAVKVVHHVNRSAAQRRNSLWQRPLPRSRPGTSLDDLKLEVRTRNCLEKAGMVRDLERLGDLTVGYLLNLPHFGTKSLVDLLVSLESFNATPWQEPSPAPEPPLEPPLPPAANLEEEILGLPLFGVKNPATANKERRQRVLARYHGLDGQGGATLLQIGGEMGITKERVRQLLRCLNTIRARPSTPFLDKVLAVTAALAPDRADRIEAELQRQGLTKHRTPLKKIVEFAEVLKMPVEFTLDEVDGGLFALRPGQKALASTVLGVARKQVHHYGAVMVASVAEQVAKETGEAVDGGIVGRIVQAARDFRWLDEVSGWFWLAQMPNSLLGKVRQVLSVAAQLPASELRDCIGRDSCRGKGWRMMVPPPAIIEELCRQAPGFRVDQGAIIADPPLDWREILQGDVKKMVQIFYDHGPVIRYEDLEEHRLQARIRRTTFYQYLSRLPVICKYGQLHGLPGTSVTPGMVEVNQERRRETAHSLVESGWTAEGSLHLTYRLTLYQVNSGAVDVPRCFRRQLQGRFLLDMGKDIGSGVKVKHSSCWGFGRLFRQREAKPGDLLRVTFDLVSKTAIASIETALDVA